MIVHKQNVLELPSHSHAVLSANVARTCSSPASRTRNAFKSSRKDGRSGAVAHPLHDDWVRRVNLHANVRYEEPCRGRVAASRVGRYLVIESREAHRSGATTSLVRGPLAHVEGLGKSVI